VSGVRSESDADWARPVRLLPAPRQSYRAAAMPGGWTKWPLRVYQWIAAGLALAAVVILGLTRSGPFSWDPPPAAQDAGFFEELLGERYTLGLVRLGLIVLALFIILSVPALIVAGRWLKGFSKEGLTADDAVAAEVNIADLQRQLKEVTEERDKVAVLATDLQLRLTTVREILEEGLSISAEIGQGAPPQEDEE
jgi:hypothetical protein